MFRKIVFSTMAMTILTAADLSASTEPAHADSHVVTAFAVKEIGASKPVHRTTHYEPSPVPRPSPFPYPGDTRPPNGPFEPSPKPSFCYPGTTKCPFVPIPYPN